MVALGGTDELSTTTEAVPRTARYRPLAKLGSGGMGEIFLASMDGPARMRKLAVVKRIKESFWEQPESRKMFESEARLAALLQHRNCVQVFDVEEDAKGRLYIAMEFIDGHTMSQVWKRAGLEAMSVPMQIWILCEALAGLHYAHELCDYTGRPLHLVHRDIAPGNIMVSYEGDVKLIDFGIAKSMTSAEETQTRVGMLKGRAEFMAPEQLDPNSPVDRRADIFGVGVILWSVLAGRRMWEGIPPIAILRQLMQGEIPTLPERTGPAGSPELRSVCERALALTPDNRYDTAEEMRRALSAWLSAQEETVAQADVGAWVARRFELERERMRELLKRELSRPFDDTRTFSAMTEFTGFGSGTASGASPGALHRGKKIALVAALVGGAAAAALFAGPTEPASDNEPAAPPTAAAVAPSPVQANHGPRRLRVAVIPSDARVLLDGALIATGPIDREVLAWNQSYELRIEREGYAPHVERVPAEGSVALTVRLHQTEAAEPELSVPARASRRRRRVETSREALDRSIETPPPAATVPPDVQSPLEPTRRTLADPYGTGAVGSSRRVRSLAESPYDR